MGGGGGAALPGWLGDALGTAGRLCSANPIAMLIFAASASNQGDACSDDPSHKRQQCKTKEDDRCKKVHLECIELCSTAPPLGKGGRTNQGMPFFNCVNQCMRDAGCPTV
jgi:hypothetical protein